ncbi:hypothetical protein [Maritimibacter alkaliphilus]|uniref:hypothetical protein n=1 Tax=Maritimibacter alkaliphilus TaxID=404236 RepID=UPI001C96EE46|nr:hypothetical protein [Maritimibacter alkaliphilus]MBY6093102.1 hypothetical protein [Maritimibacter alkaliphilus]
MFTNTAGYSNPEVDRLFDEAATATDDATRQELYTKVQQVLVEELPILWMAEQHFPTLYDERLSDLITVATGVNGSFADARFTG